MAIRHTGRFSALLTASLALNLFAAGLLAGSWLRPELARLLAAPESVGSATGIDTEALLAALPDRARARAERVIADHARALRTEAAAIGPARLEVLAAMAREPYDPAAANAALAALRDRVQDLQATAHDVVAGIALGLDAGERERFAQALFQRLTEGVPLAGLAPARGAGPQG